MRRLAFAAPALLAACSHADVCIPDPHGHVVEVHALPWSVEQAGDVLVREVDSSVLDLVDAGSLRSPVENESGTRRAFILEAGGPPEWQCEYVFLMDLVTGQVFVILGIPLPHRPFSDLVWVRDRYLVFDRWSQPHYGMHYVVDVESRALVLAAPFTDQTSMGSQDPGEPVSD